VDGEWPEINDQGWQPSRPGLTVVREWIVSAWESLLCDMIICFFPKCGILNSMDGTEDDALFHDLIERPSTLVPRDADTMDDFKPNSNDFIDSKIVSVNYTDFNKAVSRIQE